jgi:hypothetical protein
MSLLDEAEVSGGSITFPPALLGKSEHEGTQDVHDGSDGIVGRMWMSVGSVRWFYEVLVYYKAQAEEGSNIVSIQRNTKSRLSGTSALSISANGHFPQIHEISSISGD